MSKGQRTKKGNGQRISNEITTSWKRLERFFCGDLGFFGENTGLFGADSGLLGEILRIIMKGILKEYRRSRLQRYGGLFRRCGPV